MNIESDIKNGYHVFRIKEDLDADADLSVLKEMIREKVDQNASHIALVFTEGTYFYSATISVLVQCLGIVKEQAGELAIVQPNEGIQDTLRLTGLARLITIFSSENEIGN
ncbi:MAG: STAS domain-containing protein [Chitinivibrionales bacterium]|nr:STAS domain-containing protein [Chitinivibrionales bacterium]